MICQVAKDWGAELIMVGRRGNSGLSELILGSVSNYVVHHAHCSVLIVQLLDTEKLS
jgi:nucleotide-binding universal stress UspA family protein